MNLTALRELFSYRDLRNAAVGAFVVFGGLGLAGLTYYAHRTGNLSMAAVSAGVSLVFVLLILIFVVPPLAKNAGREASQMNLPFEFTTGGAIMLVLLLVVGFSAWNTGNNLLFLVLSFLIAASIVGFFAGSICLKKLDVTMRFAETIFAGEPTSILVTIRNRKRIFPAISVVVEVRGQEREQSIAMPELSAMLPHWIAKRLGRAPVIRRTLTHFPYVPARQMSEATGEHLFPNRGRLVIKDFELSTKFPFAFFRHRRRLPAREAELIVFPRVTEEEAIIDQLPLEYGTRTAHRRGMGQDLLVLRDYLPQDELRRIDWKATARTRALTVREYAADDELRVAIFFDTHIPPDEKRPGVREKLELEQTGKPVVLSERFESGASRVGSIAKRLIEQKAEVCLVINNDVGEYGAGRAHLYEMLKRLALAEPAFDDTPTDSASIEERITDRMDTHIILVTAIEAEGLPPDIARQLIIVGF